jgi:hypothetical protein
LFGFGVFRPFIIGIIAHFTAYMAVGEKFRHLKEIFGIEGFFGLDR